MIISPLVDCVREGCAGAADGFRQSRGSHAHMAFFAPARRGRNTRVKKGDIKGIICNHATSSDGAPLTRTRSRRAPGNIVVRIGAMAETGQQRREYPWLMG